MQQAPLEYRQKSEQTIVDISNFFWEKATALVEDHNDSIAGRISDLVAILGATYVNILSAIFAEMLRVYDIVEGSDQFNELRRAIVLKPLGIIVREVDTGYKNKLNKF